MNALTKTKQAIEETGNQLLAAIDSSMDQIRSLETVEAAKCAVDEIRDFDLLLKTQKVQEALGEKLAEAKQKIAQLVIEVKLQISNLAKQSADETMKGRAYERAGVRRKEIKTIESAAEIPEQQRQVYVAAKANEGTLPNIKELASLRRLPETPRAEAFAKIEDIARRPPGQRLKFSPTVATTIKSTEAKIARDWTPKTTGAPVAAHKPELPDTYYPATQILVLGNQLHTKTTALMICARRLTESDTQTGTMITRKELGELAAALEAKLGELTGVAGQTIDASRKLAGDMVETP